MDVFGNEAWKHIARIKSAFVAIYTWKELVQVSLHLMKISLKPWLQLPQDLTMHRTTPNALIALINLLP